MIGLGKKSILKIKKGFKSTSERFHLAMSGTLNISLLGFISLKKFLKFSKKKMKIIINIIRQF